MKKVDYNKLLKSAFSEAGKLAEYYRYFHNYSFGNQMLLLGQGVTGPVAKFKRWVELGRSVKKGAKAKFIFVPFTKKIEGVNEDTGEITISTMKSFFLSPCLFELTDTEGNELYSPEKELPKLDKFKIYSALEITECNWREIDGNTQGYAIPSKRQIAINPLAVYPEKTLLHEVAHCILHAKVDSLKKAHDTAIPQNLREVEAESVAYITGSFLGILSEDAKRSSRGYIQHWIDNNSIPENNAKRIFGAVDKIIKALDPNPLRKD